MVEKESQVEKKKTAERQLKKNHGGADKSVTYGHEKLSGAVTCCSTIFFLFKHMPGNFGV